MKMLGLAPVFLGLFLCGPALGSTFAPGDLLIGRSGQIDWRNSSGTPIQTIITDRPTGMRNHPITGQLWVTYFSNLVRVFDTQGNLAATYSTPGLTNAESIVFDSAGNAFIGGADVLPGPSARVIKLSPSGVYLQSFTVPREDRGSDWVDLCSDDHTLFYTSEGYRIKRFDLSTTTPLSDFADLTSFINPSGSPTRLFAIRALPNGNVLAVGSNDLYLIGSNGQVIRNYITPLDCFFSIAITPSGQEFWVQGCSFSGTMYKFNINSGALVTSFSVGFGETAGIAIVGDNTRSSCMPSTQTVGTNKDFVNNTGQPANDFEWLVAGNYSSVLSHYDGPFPGNPNSIFSTFTITQVGANTLFRWSNPGAPIAVGQTAHLGITVQGSTLETKGATWTLDGSFSGCIRQISIGRGYSHLIGQGTLSFENTVSDPPNCPSTGLFIGEISIEWLATEVPLAQLNSGATRSPLRTDVIPGTYSISVGSELPLSIPVAPTNARFAMIKVSVANNASMIDESTDYIQVTIPTPSIPLPTLSQWGIVSLLLLLVGTAAYILRRHRMQTVR